MIVLIDEQCGRTLDDVDELKVMLAIETLLEKSNTSKCFGCCHDLPDILHVSIYDHDGGWNLVDSIPAQWIAIRCPDCGYETSLQKIIRR